MKIKILLEVTIETDEFSDLEEFGIVAKRMDEKINEIARIEKVEIKQIRTEP